MPYTFFWSGPFSNWYPSQFVLNDVTFNCEEQHMMYAKAMLFGDVDTAADILLMDSPKDMQDAGRTVKNFDRAIWDAKCEEIVYEGLKQKFLQNQELFLQLCEKKGTKFVEASPKDRIWGIGFDEKNALENITSWGTNLLGNLLTKLSEEICE